MIDKCEYCGCQYHPMPRYVHVQTRRLICVCHFKVGIDEYGGPRLEPSGCPAKATADGYILRMDLTPKR